MCAHTHTLTFSSNRNLLFYSSFGGDCASRRWEEREKRLITDGRFEDQSAVNSDYWCELASSDGPFGKTRLPGGERAMQCTLDRHSITSVCCMHPPTHVRSFIRTPTHSHDASHHLSMPCLCFFPSTTSTTDLPSPSSSRSSKS